MKKNHQKTSRKNKSSQNYLNIRSLLFILFIVVVSIIFFQSSNQDIRNRAQDITPTPLLRCDVPCTYNSQCPTGLFCHQGACRHPSCPNTAGCACVITPTSNPIAQIQPTHIPTSVPTSRPTATPIPRSTITQTQTQFPTIATTPTPTSPYEAYATEPKNLTFFQAIIHYMGDIFCSILGVC